MASPGPGSPEPERQSRAGPRRWIDLAGSLVTLAAIAFVVWKVATTPAIDWHAWARPSGLATLAAAALAYALLCLALPIAWGLLLRWLGNGHDAQSTYLAIYGRSQIAKYLPGNVFHLAGRQVLAAKVGWSQSRTATASVLEHTSLMAAACLLSLIAFGLRGEGSSTATSSTTEVAGQSMILSTPVLLILMLLSLCIPAILPRFLVLLSSRVPLLSGLGLSGLGLSGLDSSKDAQPGTEESSTTTKDVALDGAAANKDGVSRPPRLANNLRHWLPVYFLHTAFLLGLGSILLFLVERIGGSSDPSLTARVATAMAPAWIAGTVTPGAAAGIGVREATLLWLLGPTIPAALAAVLGFRIATVVGDLIFFGFAMAAGGKVSGDSTATARAPGGGAR